MSLIWQLRWNPLGFLLVCLGDAIKDHKIFFWFLKTIRFHDSYQYKRREKSCRLVLEYLHATFVGALCLFQGIWRERQDKKFCMNNFEYNTQSFLIAFALLPSHNMGSFVFCHQERVKNIQNEKLIYLILFKVLVKVEKDVDHYPTASSMTPCLYYINKLFQVNSLVTAISSRNRTKSILYLWGW